MTETTTRTLSREDDHLGVIRQTLLELGGYASMAFELIQNADDNEASTMRFDVRDDALVVEDDGGFSDCGHQELRSHACPFLESHGYQCDFHSFRLFSGANKRRRENTTGAMGIGFTAVYQVTDLPTLISGTRSWVVDETAATDDRIRETELPAAFDGTRLELPWARDANSPFRQLVDVDPVPDDVQQQVATVLHEVIPPALLFLRHLSRIEIARDGEVERVVTREAVGDDLLVGDNDDTTAWRILRGSFGEAADELRARYPPIEGSRQEEVVVAVPLEDDVVGLLCATLPTQTASGLPLHVNADFFMSRDRRRPMFSTPFAAEWNRAAIDCVAAMFAEHLDELASILGQKRLWTLLDRAWKLREADDDDPTSEALTACWGHLEPAVAASPVVATHAGACVAPSSAVLSHAPEDTATLDALTRLGLHLVHPELRPFRNVLLSVGASQLRVDDIAGALEELDLPDDTDLAEVPEPFADADVRQIVWNEIGRLVSEMSEGQVEAARSVLEDIPFLPSIEGVSTSIAVAYCADADTRRLFAPLVDYPLVDDEVLPQSLAPLLAECDQLTPQVAIRALDGHEHIAPRVGAQLVAWFARQRDFEAADTDLSHRHIVPVSGRAECVQLADASLPGRFTDVLGIALLIDTEVAERHGHFLRDLGVTELTLDSYIGTHVANALGDAADPLPTDVRRAVVELLARHWSEVTDDEDVRATVLGLPIVETVHGDWVAPAAAYRDSSDVRTVLGDLAPIARIPGTRTHGFESLLDDLDVALEPRPLDVVARVRSLVAGPVTETSVEGIARVVEWLGRVWPEWAPASRLGLETLRSLAWLPLRGSDDWHPPSELDLMFQAPAFESQGAFVALPRATQQRAAGFLQDLGLSAVPTTRQVVDHLLYCAEHGGQPSTMVYSTLDDRSEDAELLDLVDERCLRLDGRWYRPDEVYWSRHPFGRWRITLSGEMGDFRQLLERLGVRNEPCPSDAIAVLQNIAADLGPGHDELAEDDRAVVLDCWRFCESALLAGEIDESDLLELRSEPTVCDDRGVLMRPTLLLFEDMPRLAREFPQLKDHIIRRPDGAAIALAAAGVRNLSEAATGTVVDLGDRVPSDALQTVTAREAQLARLISGSGAAWREVSIALRELSWVTTTALSVAWEIEEHGTRLASTPRSEQAFWDRGAGELYVVVDRGRPVSWNVVARELLRAIWPDVPPPSVAMALGAVLAADTTAAADKELDEAGFAELAAEIATVVAGAAVEAFDTASADDEPDGEAHDIAAEYPVPTGDDEDSDDDSEDVDDSDEAGEDDADDDEAGDDNEDDDEAEASGELGHDTTGATGSRGAPAGGGEQGRSSSRTGSTTSSGSASRLRSYVSPDGDGEPDADIADATPDRQSAISEVDQAGIAAVVDYETRHGRDPEVMAHNNPGFDVRSTYDDGEIARWIEVKSTAGAWDAAGVALSPRQFDFARRADEGQCWLYVVEYALSDSQRHVWPIPDPVGQITDYMFDEGWKTLAEPDDDAPPQTDEDE